MKRLDRIIPRYVYLPMITMFLWNLVVYYCSKLISHHTGHHAAWELVIGGVNLDKAVPFVPFFMLIYLLSYLQWALGFFFICRESREIGYPVIAAEMIAKVICLIFFIAWPMWLVRPEVTGNGFFAWLTRFIYAVDEPTNLFPSIHCLESWLCFRCALSLKKMPKWYAPFQFVFTLFVFASTVMVRQHVLLDVVAGVLVAEFGLWLEKRLRADRLFYRLEPSWARQSESAEKEEIRP